jgi:hypothetical protein
LYPIAPHCPRSAVSCCRQAHNLAAYATHCAPPVVPRPIRIPHASAHWQLCTTSSLTHHSLGVSADCDLRLPFRAPLASLPRRSSCPRAERLVGQQRVEAVSPPDRSCWAKTLPLHHRRRCSWAVVPVNLSLAPPVIAPWFFPSHLLIDVDFRFPVLFITSGRPTLDKAGLYFLPLFFLLFFFFLLPPPPAAGAGAGLASNSAFLSPKPALLLSS